MRLRPPGGPRLCRACGQTLLSAGTVARPLVNATAAASSPATRHHLSTTRPLERISTQRKTMYEWLQRHGRRFEAPSGEDSNYLGPLPGQPFPMNPLFRSQSILSEELREQIWNSVAAGQAIKAVSAAHNVHVKRVAALVRMKVIEKQWLAENRPLATKYSQAIMAMLPQTMTREQCLQRNVEHNPHEPIGDIHGHGLTMRQLFMPASESRHFTRRDAAKAFHEYLLPADDRTPNPELVALERQLDAVDTAGDPQAVADAIQRFRTAARESEDGLVDGAREGELRREGRTTRIESDRFEFRFENVSANSGGRDGRSRRGVGWRYGVPMFDRKKGRIKIPTQVPAVASTN